MHGWCVHTHSHSHRERGRHRSVCGWWGCPSVLWSSELSSRASEGSAPSPAGRHSARPHPRSSGWEGDSTRAVWGHQQKQKERSPRPTRQPRGRRRGSAWRRERGRCVSVGGREGCVWRGVSEMCIRRVQAGFNSPLWLQRWKWPDL